MPLPSTRAMFDRKKYGLPTIFEVDYKAHRSPVYIKSLSNARQSARRKQAEIEGVISKDLGGSVHNETHILEKIKRSSRKINLL